MFKPNDTYVLEICWDAGLSDVRLLVLSQIPVLPLWFIVCWVGVVVANAIYLNEFL